MQKNKLKINTVLKEAGCTNLFDLSQDKKCTVEENEESREWNKVKKVYDQKRKEVTHGNKMRWIDLMVDGDFLEAIEETIESLESISRTANNQRSKYKRLHIRHAALTMDTKDLSKLLLQKASDLPEPQHTIIDDETGERRPCRSHEEVMESTFNLELVLMAKRLISIFRGLNSIMFLMFLIRKHRCAATDGSRSDMIKKF